MQLSQEIGFKLSEMINEKRMYNFVKNELFKLGIDTSEDIKIFNVIRFDNFFFQSRYIFICKQNFIYIKKMLDKKSEWIIAKKGEIKVEPVSPSFFDKIAVFNCGKLYKLSYTQESKVLKPGKRFFAIDNNKEHVVTYSPNMTEEFISSL